MSIIHFMHQLYRVVKQLDGELLQFWSINEFFDVVYDGNEYLQFIHWLVQLGAIFTTFLLFHQIVQHTSFECCSYAN